MLAVIDADDIGEFVFHVFNVVIDVLLSARDSIVHAIGEILLHEFRT